MRVLVALVVAVAVLGAAPPAAGEEAWVWPVEGRVLTPYSNDNGQPYAGGMHRGIDIAAATGAGVVAARAGTVTHAGVVGSVRPHGRRADGGRAPRDELSAPRRGRGEEGRRGRRGRADRRGRHQRATLGRRAAPALRRPPGRGGGPLRRSARRCCRRSRPRDRRPAPPPAPCARRSPCAAAPVPDPSRSAIPRAGPRRPGAPARVRPRGTVQPGPAVAPAPSLAPCAAAVRMRTGRIAGAFPAGPAPRSGSRRAVAPARPGRRSCRRSAAGMRARDSAWCSRGSA